MDKSAIMKWVKFISFAFLLLGGLNWLLIGLFEFDLFGSILGGMDSVASRFFYTLFGLGAVVLLSVVLVKALKKDGGAGNQKAKATEKEA